MSRGIVRTSDDIPLLEVNDLRTRFHIAEGTVYAVNGVSFTAGRRRDAGRGRRERLRQIRHDDVDPAADPHPAGRDRQRARRCYRERDLLKLTENEMEHIRGKEIAMVFQDPMTSLNPVLTIGRQITESLRVHLGMDEAQAHERAIELLEQVGIPDPARRLSDYPHQFSGGMRQRVMIAMALACAPSLLIADEPTTALDVTIQAQIIELVKRLRDELGMAIIWITHDLGVVAGLAERVIVMYAGLHRRRSERRRDLRRPAASLHPAPCWKPCRGVDRRRDRRLKSIPGAPPNLLVEPHGCPFAPRCDFAIERCREENPSLEPVGYSTTRSPAGWT